MTSIFTTKKQGTLIWLRAIFTYFLGIALPIAAQTQTTNTTLELEKKMHALYDKAEQLYAELPKRDFRGSYLTMAVGTSAFGHIGTWKTENVCDCSGNVVGTKDVASVDFPMAWSVGYENRLLNFFSARMMLSYAHLSQRKGENILSSNGAMTQLKQDYRLSQYGFHGSGLIHLGNIYFGAGASKTISSASGFQTEQTQQTQYPYPRNEPPPQYLDIKADVLTPQREDIAAHYFVGYRMMWSPNLFSSVEVGVAQGLYFNFQLNVPLSGRSKQSLRGWREKKRAYSAVKNQAVMLDRQLHPNKFSDCSNDIFDFSTPSSSCPN